MSNSKELTAISSDALRTWVISETHKRSGGKTQTELALALGLKQATISGWVVAGRSYLPETTISAIAKYRGNTYQKTLDFLTEGIEKQLAHPSDTNLRFEKLERKIEDQSQIILDILAGLRTTGDELKRLKNQITNKRPDNVSSNAARIL